MMAIGTEYGNSSRSNTLLINSPGSRFSAGQMLDSSIVDFESWEASDQTDLKVGIKMAPYSSTSDMSISPKTMKTSA